MITLTILDRRWFPFSCCGVEWSDPGVLMAHLLESGSRHNESER